MKFGESEGKYLKGADLQGREVDVVIESIQIANVGDDEERKFVAYFLGKTKGMVLNVTNCEILVGLHGESGAGEDDTQRLTAHYAGKAVRLWFDPSVKYAGKRVGGLRFKASSLPSTPSPSSHPQPQGVTGYAVALDPPLPDDPHAGGGAADDGEIPF